MKVGRAHYRSDHGFGVFWGLRDTFGTEDSIPDIQFKECIEDEQKDHKICCCKVLIVFYLEIDVPFSDTRHYQRVFGKSAVSSAIKTLCGV